jgi:hypothetical protein
MVEKEGNYWRESNFHKKASGEDLEKIPKQAFGF